MNIHKNARLTLARRIEMVQDITVHGLSACAAAQAHGVSAPTARKWLGRYLALGQTAVAALKPDTEKDKTGQKSTLKEIDTQLDALASKEDKLAKYKTVATAIKTYLGAIGTGTIYESLVWGQHMVHKSGGVPADIPNLNVENLHRISYTLNVQGTSVKATSTFSADKVRYFATAEIYYSLFAADGVPVATGVMSKSTTPTELEIKSLMGAPYSKAY